MNLSKALELTLAAKEDIRKILELEELIKNAITEEEAKKKGNLSIFKLVKKYIEETKKKCVNTNLHGVKINADNKMLFSNSFSGFRLNTILESLPVVENFLDLESIIDKTRDNNNIKVDAPDLKDLKSQFKIAKAVKKAKKNKKITDVKEGLFKINNSYVDIELLIEVIEILGNEEIEIYTGEKEINAIYFKSPEGDAILLPIRIPEDMKDKIENVS